MTPTDPAGPHRPAATGGRPRRPAPTMALAVPARVDAADIGSSSPAAVATPVRPQAPLLSLIGESR
jgi:hypothetical protein